VLRNEEPQVGFGVARNILSVFSLVII